MPAPLASAASPTSAIGSLMSGTPGQGADQVRAQLEALASQVRDISQMVDAVATDLPTVQAEASQIKALLKQMIVKAAAQAPPQTASSMAVPTGSSMGAGPQ